MRLMLSCPIRLPGCEPNERARALSVRLTLLVAVMLCGVVMAGCGSKKAPRPLNEARPEQGGPALSPRGTAQVLIAALQSATPVKEERKVVEERLLAMLRPVDTDNRNEVKDLVTGLVDRWIAVQGSLASVEVADAFVHTLAARDKKKEESLAVVVIRVVNRDNAGVTFMPLYMTRVEDRWLIMPARNQPAGAGDVLPAISGLDQVFLGLEDDQMQAWRLVIEEYGKMVLRLV